MQKLKRRLDQAFRGGSGTNKSANISGGGKELDSCAKKEATNNGSNSDHKNGTNCEQHSSAALFEGSQFYEKNRRNGRANHQHHNQTQSTATAASNNFDSSNGFLSTSLNPPNVGGGSSENILPFGGKCRPTYSGSSSQFRHVQFLMLMKY